MTCLASNTRTFLYFLNSDKRNKLKKVESAHPVYHWEENKSDGVFENSF